MLKGCRIVSKMKDVCATGPFTYLTLKYLAGIPNEKCLPVPDDIVNTSSFWTFTPSFDHSTFRPSAVELLSALTATVMTDHSKPSSKVPVNVALLPRGVVDEFRVDTFAFPDTTTDDIVTSAVTVPLFRSKSVETMDAPAHRGEKRAEEISAKNPAMSRVSRNLRTNFFRISSPCRSRLNPWPS